MRYTAPKLIVAILFFSSFVVIPRIAQALDSSDLTFQLSFENGIEPEFSRGSSRPTMTPTDLQRRIVAGLIGKGYLFAGKSSTIEFKNDDDGSHANAEMYSPKGNLFGDEGTVSLWVKQLANTHNMVHRYFMATDPYGIQLARTQYQQQVFWYGGKHGQIYDHPIPADGWFQFAVTWRKGELRGYMNGTLVSVVPDLDIKPTPQTLQLAAEGLSWLDFQKKEFEDDAVLDEVQFFRRPLAPEEIRSLFERGHVSFASATGNVGATAIKPERIYAPAMLSAPYVAAPIQVDGDLSDWKEIPAQGGFTERRLAVLDNDDAKVLVAVDGKNLYLAFRTEVDAALQADPRHVMYPAGEYKAGVLQCDGDVYADDYIEYTLRGKDDHVYRFAVNARGALLDSRDGDNGWNSHARVVSRSDFKDWTAEMAIPLSEIGMAPGAVVGFNAVRSWKWFKSSQNTLCFDEQYQPSLASLALGAPSTAAVDGLGHPERGDLDLTGSIAGLTGSYTIRIHGRGFGQEFQAEQKVDVKAKDSLTSFEVKHRLEKPGDLAVQIDVLDPSGKIVMTRVISFVYVAATSVEQANYPGWGKLDVTVAPLDPKMKDLTARVSLAQHGKSVQVQTIAAFADPAETVRFETKELPAGVYDLVTELVADGNKIGEDHQTYTKKPLPEWYYSKAGIVDGPPVPWTDMQVQGSTIKCLMKQISFNHTLFPARIVSNGQELLAGPVRLHLKLDGTDKVITAGDFKIIEKTRRRVSWVSTAQDGDLNIKVSGWIEFDGFTWMKLTLAGGKVDHVAVEVPLKNVTLKTLDGTGLMGDQPLSAPYEACGYWFGNGKAGLQYWWESNQGWVVDNRATWKDARGSSKSGEPVTVTPAGSSISITFPFIQKPVELNGPRAIEFGWAITPAKPLRKDWRSLDRYRYGYLTGNYKYHSVEYTNFDYCYATPNYPKAINPAEIAHAAEVWKQQNKTALWYAFGTNMWIGSPEYSDWWREWRNTPGPLIKPDPNSQAWAQVCANSSAANFYLDMLEKFVKEYPQRGIYFDCMNAVNCDNPAHGDGWIDDAGHRQPKSDLLAQRRFYERVYNIIKAADPQYGWVRFHDWNNNMAIDAFCDENWIGEGLIGALQAAPQNNYYSVVDSAWARVEFNSEKWGILQNWLTEMAVSAGEDKEKHAGWYGKMISPPRNGQHGVWVLPRWNDYEHVAGLAFTNDSWNVWGNDLQLPITRLGLMQDHLGWGPDVQFIGYWELGDALQVDGGVPEKVVCSIYYKPASKDATGKAIAPWLLLVPFNNTDEDVTITLRPNLRKFGLAQFANGTLLDEYRATDFTFVGHPGWLANAGDPEPPHIHVAATKESFPLISGSAQVTIAKRNFRALLLQAKNSPEGVQQ
jgi:hypothetical protein